MNIDNLTMSFGMQKIFENVSIHIKIGEKVGIIGVNGAGKSTLFKLIRGEIQPEEGKIILERNARIGFLPQVIKDEVPDMDMTVFDFLSEGRPIKKLEKELADLYNSIAGESSERKLKEDMRKIDKVEANLQYFDVYDAEAILLKIIYGMNIDDELLGRKLVQLSGGQKSKIAFARLLYSKPEILLLDEPTNHLDIDTKDYIIEYLKKYHGTVLVISHDIEFLSQVTTQTLYIDKNRHSMELYPGNYEKYLTIKNEREKTLVRIAEKQDAEEQKLKKIISKYIKGTEKQAKVAKDRQKKLAKLEANRVILDRKIRTANFKIEIDHRSGLLPLKCQNITFGYAKNSLLFKNLTFDLERGEKFLIVGANGIGKSTLLKLIVGELTPLDGKIILNEKTDIGYYAQEHEVLEESKSILDNFSSAGISKTELRKFLGNFLFYGEDVHKMIYNLSPGERSRVALAKLAISGANFLILDEPTNHLDPETQKIIADAFRNYAGTMLVVSHNFEFIENLGIKRMLILPEGKIRDYDSETVLYYQELNSVKG